MTMADGVGVIEVRSEQGKLVHRFTITRQDIREQGADYLVQSAINALPVEKIARKVWDAMDKGR